ncbi:hypothetical protein SAMN05421812_10511 [Asanoa hainanensis]|uniref:Uncharacterized protein n=1 Tax=Asanoa hainanensis TaxID=560556 RepID=A0A239M071_9ACTN|nr:hypothetical protein SAMN05421812_10511 [Asanoa hainanensis]
MRETARIDGNRYRTDMEPKRTVPVPEATVAGDWTILGILATIAVFLRRRRKA